MLATFMTFSARSPVYESPALLPENAPAGWDMPYYNMAVAGQSALAPEELLKAVKQVEQKLGRQDRGRWGPREIDIDILAFGDTRMNTEALTLPHPGLLQRDFALVPFADVAPGWVHPASGMTAAELAAPLRAGLRRAAVTKLMGILNLTPDSFSGDGLYGSTQETLKSRVETMISGGAAVIDVGAESTRPGARVLSADEEWERLTPLLPAVRAHAGRVLFSLDTYHAQTAAKALGEGFLWINDVSAGRDAALLGEVRKAGATLVLMHSLTVPADPRTTLPADCDPVKEVCDWGTAALGRLEDAGIARKNIILDPGIGFGKTAVQSLALVRSIATFRQWGVRMLVGHSRKSFLGAIAHGNEQDRVPATLAVSAHLLREQADFVRVHDVAAHRALFATLGELL